MPAAAALNTTDSFFLLSTSGDVIWSSGTITYIDDGPTLALIIAQTETTSMTMSPTLTLSTTIAIALASMMETAGSVSINNILTITELGNVETVKALTLAIQNAFTTIGYETIALSLTLPLIDGFSAAGQPSFLQTLTLAIVESLADSGYILGPDAVSLVSSYVQRAQIIHSILVGETFLVPGIQNGYLTRSSFQSESIDA